MVLSKEKHERVYDIAITGTSDAGSGVKDIIIYAQALDSPTDTVSFSQAEQIGVLYNVDHLPSYCSDTSVTDYNKLILRKADGSPASTTSEAQHGSNHIYIFEFDNYINGKYYAFWALGVDKAGNIESLNADGAVNSADTPLIMSASPLVDDTVPQFEGILQLPDIYYDDVNAGWYLPDKQSVSGQIIIFTLIDVNGNTQEFHRYVKHVTFLLDDDGNAFTYLDIDDASLNGSRAVVAGSTFRMPEFYKAVGGVGYITIDFPACQSSAFGSYEIHRLQEIETSSGYYEPVNNDAPENLQYRLVAFGVVDNQFTSTGLKYSTGSLDDHIYLYRIYPVSKYDSNIKGMPIYLTDVGIFDSYRPSVGIAPSDPSSFTAAPNESTGHITLTWDNAADENNDIKGYVIYRKVGIDADDNGIFGSSSEYMLLGSVDYPIDSYVDTATSPYLPDGIKYQYKIVTIDWAGNESSGVESELVAASRISYVSDNEGVSLAGIIGGWKIQLTAGESSDALYVDLEGRHGTIADLSAESYQPIGRIYLSLINGTYISTTTWIDVDPSTQLYGQVKATFYDKWGNTGTVVESLSIQSITPQSSADDTPPSVQGYSLSASADAAGETVTIDVAVPQDLLSQTASSSVDISTGTTVTITGLGAVDDIYKGWDFIVHNSDGVEIERAQISGNSGDEIYIARQLQVDPSEAGNTVDIKKAADLAGYILYKTQVINGAFGAYVVVLDTHSRMGDVDFSIVDTNLKTGDWAYKLTAYDLNGNESESVGSNIVTVEDTVAPGTPTVQNVVGGAGSLTFTWNSPANDVAKYEFTAQVNGADIGGGQITLTGDIITVTLYGITNTKNDILSNLTTKIVTYDEANNSSDTGFIAPSSDIIFLDDYIPSDSANTIAPNASVSLLTDNDGKVNVTLNTAGLTYGTDIAAGTRFLRLYANYKDINTGTLLDSEILVSTFTIPSIDNNNIISSDITYLHVVNQNVTVEYYLQGILVSGAVSDFTGTTSINVTDTTGPILVGTDINALFQVDTGAVHISFNDVIDKNSAVYEIYRTPVVNYSWSQSTFFVDTNQPKTVHNNWEKIIAIPSTRSNISGQDILSYSDNDWQSDGHIDPEDTTLSIKYEGQAVYAIVAIDRWGNRGDVIFVSYQAPRNDGIFNELCIVNMPYEPRNYYIPQGALYWNFNQSVQANRGDVPYTDPNALLYPQYGIQVTGDLSYQLDKFNEDFSILMRRLQKTFTQLNISTSDIVDIQIYDTKEDTIDQRWRFNSSLSWYNEPFSDTRGYSKEFPEVAIVVAVNEYRLQRILIMDYSTGSLWMEIHTVAGADTSLFWPNRDEYDITSSIVMKNGVLYIGNDNTGTINYALGIRRIDFTNDKLYGHRVESGSWYGTWSGQIINRHDDTGTQVWDLITVGKLRTTDVSKVLVADINNTTYLITINTPSPADLSLYSLTVVNLSTKTSLYTKTKDIHYTSISIKNNYIYAIREDDTAIYKSTLPIDQLDWSTNGASIIEFEIVANDNSVVNTNKALEYNDYNDSLRYLLLDSNLEQFNSNDFTIIVKMKVPQYDLYNAGYYGLFYLVESHTTYYIRLLVDFINNNINFRQEYNDVSVITDNSSVELDKYINKEITLALKNEDNKRYTYVNGQIALIEDSTIGLLPYNFVSFKLLASGWGTSYPDRFYKLQWFNYALPDNKIAKYTLGAPISEEDKWGMMLLNSSGDTIDGWSKPSTNDVLESVLSTGAGFTTNVLKLTATDASTYGYHRFWASAGAQIEEFKNGYVYTISFKYRSNIDVTVCNRDTAIETVVSNEDSAKLIEIEYAPYNITWSYAYLLFRFSATSTDGWMEIDDVEVKIKGCIAEWSADNYDESTGTLHTTEWIEQGDESAEDKLAFVQSTEENRPQLIEAPAKYSLIDRNDYVKAYNLDGKDDYLVVPDDANINFGTGDFSILINMLIPSKNTDLERPTVFSKSDYPGVITGILIRNNNYNDGIYGFYALDVDGNGGIVSFEPIRDEFANYYFERSGSILAYEINGNNYIAEDKGTIANVDVATDLQFGHGSINGVDSYGIFKYYTIRLFNKALTSEEREYIYTTGKVPYELKSNLVLELTPDNIHPTIWKDTSGNGLHATPYGDPEVITNQPIPTDIVSNDKHVAVSFKSKLEEGRGGLIIIDEE